MSQEENVDTLDEEITQNTDTDVEEANDVSSTEESQNTEDSSEDTNDNDDAVESKEDSEELGEEELATMSDEEFVEYLNSGKVPDKKEEEKKPTADKAKVVSKPSATKADKPKSADVNYEDVYKKIFTPFRANGKEITPRTVEDVISLMQMGANYTKKMQAMAPMRKVVESLDKAQITEEDLNFLIDLHKGDKEAIKELIKKNNIDIIDLDLDEIDYKPNKNNIASDEDVSFAEMLTDINESIPQIKEVLNNTWDAESKKLLLSDPRAMRALHEEISMGRFEKVQKQLEIEKTFGRYKGVPDVHAYIDLVNRMVANEQVNETSTKKESSKPSKNIPDKRKAAPSRGTSKSSSTLTAKDLFSMSDEEFERLSIKDLV